MSIQFPLALQLWPRYFYNFVCFQHTNPEFLVHFPLFPTYAYLCHKKFIFYNLNLIKLGIWIYVIISFCTTILDIKENKFQFQGKILSDILPAYLLWALFKIKGKITYRVLQFYFLSLLSKVFCHQFKYFLTLICFQAFFLIKTLLYYNQEVIETFVIYRLAYIFSHINLDLFPISSYYLAHRIQQPILELQIWILQIFWLIDQVLQ